MASVHRANGTAVSKTALTALLTEVEQPVKYTVPEKITRKFRTSGASGSKHDSQDETLFYEGQVITQEDLDRAFPPATFTSMTPAAGLAAGGDVVTIKGKNLGGTTGVTFGGTAGTAFSVVDDETITVTTPAKAAGPHAVVVQDDAGNVAAGDFTYA